MPVITTVIVENNNGCKVTVTTTDGPIPNLRQTNGVTPPQLRGLKHIECQLRRYCKCEEYSKSATEFLDVLSTAYVSDEMCRTGATFKPLVLYVAKHALGIPFLE